MSKKNEQALIEGILWKEQVENTKWESFHAPPERPETLPVSFSGTVHSQTFLIMEAETNNHLQTRFSWPEIGRIYAIAGMVTMGEFCVVMNTETGTGHNRETLRKALRCRKETFLSFFHKMIQENVIVVVQAPFQGQEVERILFNPTIARKSDYVYGMALSLFTDIRDRVVRKTPQVSKTYSFRIVPPRPEL